MSRLGLQEVLLTAICALIATQGLAAEHHEPLSYSCPDERFVGVSASTSERSSVPSLELTVKDPSLRTQGQEAQGNQIPTSRYGEIAEIPKEPQHSKALAVEVCNAEIGVYEINISEHGSSHYSLTVQGQNGTGGSESLILHHISHDGRTRRYRFILKTTNGKLSLRWLDSEGHESIKIENSDW
jgi:hypothetical protein